jgi:hypothetical protein
MSTFMPPAFSKCRKMLKPDWSNPQADHMSYVRYVPTLVTDSVGVENLEGTVRASGVAPSYFIRDHPIRHRRRETEQTRIAVMLQTCILKVPISNLGPATGYSD